MPNAGKWGLTPGGDQPLLADGSVSMEADFDMGGHEVLNPGWVKQVGDIMVGSAVGEHSPLTVSDDGKIIIADSGKALGVKYAGQLVPLNGAFRSANSNPSHLVYPVYASFSGTSIHQYWLPGVNGTIVGVTGLIDITAYTAGTVELRVYKNYVYTGDVAQLPAPAVGDGHQWNQWGFTTTFGATDRLALVRQVVGGVGVTTQKIQCFLWVRLEKA